MLRVFAGVRAMKPEVAITDTDTDTDAGTDAGTDTGTGTGGSASSASGDGEGGANKGVCSSAAAEPASTVLPLQALESRVPATLAYSYNAMDEINLSMEVQLRKVNFGHAIDYITRLVMRSSSDGGGGGSRGSNSCGNLAGGYKYLYIGGHSEQDVHAAAPASHVFVSQTCPTKMQKWVDNAMEKANSGYVVIQATEREHAGAAQLLHHALKTLQSA